jgi:hypothetical protein
MKRNPLKLLLLLVLFPCASFADDLYQFVWHGDSNLFQAGFVLTEAEMQMGYTNIPWIPSDVFRQSFSVTRPDGMTIREDWSLYVWFDGPDYQGPHVSLFAGDDGSSIYAHAFGNVMESGPHGGSYYTQYWSETGNWTVSEVPEPSAAVLSLLGVIAFLAKKRNR